MEKFRLNLQMFAEGETGGESAPAPAAEGAATAAESAADVTISAGDTLPNGQAVTSQVAAAMNRQMQRHPELRKVYGQTQKAAAGAPAQGAADQIETEWEEAKKGKYAELYGRDVQNAIQDRFKNAKSEHDDLVAAQERLNKLEPMLKIFRERAGVQNDDDLINQVMNDDETLEDEANERGMTTDALREYKKLEKELNQRKAAEEASAQQQMIQNHLQGLAKQAEEFRQIIPGFDLRKELQENETFRRLTGPGINMGVREAYFATHHDELVPELLRAGMERARQQMGQTLQAQRNRPTEGAMKAPGKPSADVQIDFKGLTRQERNRVYDFVHRKGAVNFK